MQLHNLFYLSLLYTFATQIDSVTYEVMELYFHDY